MLVDHENGLVRYVKSGILNYYPIEERMRLKQVQKIKGPLLCNYLLDIRKTNHLDKILPPTQVSDLKLIILE